MTIEEAYKKGQEKLFLAGIEEYETDNRILFEYATSISTASFFMMKSEKISENDYLKYDALLEKRIKRIPVQYITGRQYFMGLEFKVNENVLIPRYDTEILVEKLLSKTKENMRVLDICTGSGCIILSLAKLGKITGIATDISEEALTIARENAVSLKVENVTFIRTNLFEGINEQFDIVVSNPPYIETDEINKLSEEVKNHEPILALDGGLDGLDFYRTLVKSVKSVIKKDGIFAVEIGYNQGHAVKKLFEDASFRNVEIIKDYAGLDRDVIGIL